MLPATALVVLAMTACTTPAARTTTPTDDASAVVSALGAVPIPSPGTSQPLPTASGTRPQVLAMGERVLVDLGAGNRVVATASGPQQDDPTPGEPSVGPGARTGATITLAATGTSGTVTLDAADLTCRDDTGHLIALVAQGTRTTVVRAGSTGHLAVRATFDSGSAQLTWAPRHAGQHPLAVWDFTIELD